MDILKYFYEEPVALEILSDDADPDARRQQGGTGPTMSLEALLNAPSYYRGYLAGTDLGAGRTGLTALAHPEAFVAPLLALATGTWWHVDAAEAVTRLDREGAAAVLRDPSATHLLAAAPAALDVGLLVPAAGQPRRHALPALRRLLDAAEVALLPEPAHHGFDWSLFADRPLREAFTEALGRHAHAEARAFVLPFRQARSEEKFYFEQYDLEKYADYRVY